MWQQINILAITGIATKTRKTTTSATTTTTTATATTKTFAATIEATVPLTTQQEK